MSTKRIMDTNGTARSYKRWPEALKREIVAASLAPGASVSVVARQYDVNANQVFSWRKRFPMVREPATAAPGLVPVTITPEPDDDGGATPTASPSADVIEIVVCDAYVVRVGSHFDARSLRRVLDVLRRR